MSQSSSSTILDLAEVGEFFTERIASGDLDIKNLTLEGLEFLLLYFISVNEKEGKLEKKIQKSSSSSSNQNNYWSYSWTNNQV